jgi:hypothetical protein
LGAPTLFEYLRTGAFLESVFENWESEFLQMATFVVATIWLYQRGSAESRDPDVPSAQVDENPAAHRRDPEAPWPVRRGGFVLRVYSNSLSLALAVLFVASLALHAVARSMVVAEETGARPGVVGVLTDPQFWYESFQNWQSEFLSILVLVVLSIFLRQRGSPESKPVHFAHSRTGKD